MSDGLTINPDISIFQAERSSKHITVLSGVNNSGKSAVLKRIKAQLGVSAYLIGPVRFYHVHQLASQEKDPNELHNLESQFQQQFTQTNTNHEQNFLNLTNILINLSDTDRNKLFEICGELIGSKFTLKQTDPNNIMSMRYIDMDGQNLGLGSTGTRLLMTMLGICMDKRFTTILIDEPELGLSPKIQEAFSDFLFNESRRSQIFPHLENIYIATHSHLFLDRKDPENNFIISKNGNTVSITKIKTISELHRLQFNLLGNSLERIFLPSAFVIVEGPSDFKYLKRLIELKFPDKRITIADGQGDVKRVVNSTIETLGGDLNKSPYKDRLFVVNDSVTSPGLKAILAQKGIIGDKFISWDKNGIEYLYPPNILGEIFGISPEKILNELQINNDDIEVRSISRKKNSLSDEIVSKLTPDTELPKELIDKLLEPILRAIS